MQVLKQPFVAKYGRIEHQLEEFKTGFQQEVDETIGKNLSEICDFKASITQHHTKLKKRVASCATEEHVTAFRESIEADAGSLANKALFLDDAAQAQGSVLRWKQLVRHQRAYEEGKASLKRLLRKTLTNIMSRRKRGGFERWIYYRNWHRKEDLQKAKALALICKRLEMHLSASKTTMFYHWRRLAVLEKMRHLRSAAPGEKAALDIKHVICSLRKTCKEQRTLSYKR